MLHNWHPNYTPLEFAIRHLRVSDHLTELETELLDYLHTYQGNLEEFKEIIDPIYNQVIIRENSEYEILNAIYNNDNN